MPNLSVPFVGTLFFMSKKILLIQFRDNPEILAQELNCFIEKSALPADSFDTKNALNGPITLADCQAYDAIILGGSGDYLVSQNDIPKTIEQIKNLLIDLRVAKKPVLGVCFGAQLMAHCFGGRVELDAAKQETGAFEVIAEDAAQADPVFQNLPASFYATLGHKDHITQIPPGAIRLAHSALSPTQAFTFPGEKLYAFLFHPELDCESMTYRLQRYAENYSVTPEKLAQMIASFNKSVAHSVQAYQNFLAL